MTRYAYAFRNPTFVNPSTGVVMPNDTGWQTRHAQALRAPRDHEREIIALIEAWAQYADRHAERYEAGIGKDGYLGDHWHDLGRSIHKLLDGETGRLDCGTLSSFIHNTLRAEGFADE